VGAHRQRDAGLSAPTRSDRRVLTPDGWLNTGDLGYLLDGRIFVTGREKDMIIVGGRNFWPQDLEYVAESQETVRTGDSMAFSISDDGGERVVLLIQSRELDRSAHPLQHTVRAHQDRVRFINTLNSSTPGAAEDVVGKLSRSRSPHVWRRSKMAGVARRAHRLHASGRIEPRALRCRGQRCDGFIGILRYLTGADTWSVYRRCAGLGTASHGSAVILSMDAGCRIVEGCDAVLHCAWLRGALRGFRRYHVAGTERIASAAAEPV
jgi:hypothetical protein